MTRWPQQVNNKQYLRIALMKAPIARCHLARRALYPGEPQGSLYETHPCPASLLCTWGS